MSSPSWVRFVRLVPWLGCAALTMSLAMALLRGDFPWYIVELAAIGTTLLAVSVLLVWVLIRPPREKLRFALPSPLPVAAMTTLLHALVLAPHRVAWQQYMSSRQPQLDVFVQELLSYGQIHEMSDGLRAAKRLNDRLFQDSSRAVGPEHPLLAALLESQHIDAARYEHFRRQLIQLHFIEV